MSSVTGMALCRSVFLESLLVRHKLQALKKPTLSSLSYPPNFSKITYPPLLSQCSSRMSFCNLSSSSSSMEAPPEGYRRNVGICLINPSKKVSMLATSNTTYLSFVLFFCFYLNCASLSCADFCCFQDRYSWLLANATGSFINSSCVLISVTFVFNQFDPIPSSFGC